MTVLPSGQGNLELQGRVEFQGREPAPSETWIEQLTISLHDLVSGDLINQQVTMTDQEGRFTVWFNAEPGNYQVYVNGVNTLARGGQLPLPTSAFFGQLASGDANGDNFITLLDFSILASSFGLMEGLPGYDERSDFNRDGFITLLDFSILAANFGSQGAEKCDILTEMLLVLAEKVS